MDGWKIDKLTLMAILGSKKCWSKSVPIFSLFSLFFLILQETSKNAFLSEMNGTKDFLVYMQTL